MFLVYLVSVVYGFLFQHQMRDVVHTNDSLKQQLALLELTVNDKQAVIDMHDQRNKVTA